MPIQTVVRSDEHKAELRSMLNEVRDDIPIGGGTRMFSALSRVLENVERGQPVSTYVVCLTDGDTSDTDEQLREQLRQSRNNIHLCVIGINLFEHYEDRMRLLCRKYSNTRRTKGFYVGSESTTESMSRAFQRVANAIPVSQTFDLLGAPTDDECRSLIDRHAPQESKNNMQLLNFWISFLYRRISVLDKNHAFNYNQTKENLGAILFNLMKSEVKRLLENNQERDWLETNYSQLIYDFSDPERPEFRLLCTSPKMMDTALKEEYQELNLPGFIIPTESMLNKRSTLDKLVSQAMGIPLEGVPGDERIRCIDECGFVQTLDSAAKLLNIYERFASRVPNIIEGETGVSKTALSRMFSTLLNSALSAEAKKSTIARLSEIENEASSLGFIVGDGQSSADRLIGALKNSQGVTSQQTELSLWLHGKLKYLCCQRSPIFRDLPAELDSADCKVATRMVMFVEQCLLEQTFFELNIHSALSESEVVNYFAHVRETARKLIPAGATIVVFLDEVNTTSVMGLFKEIVVDHSLLGDSLEPNIVVIAACNPARQNLNVGSKNAREVDMGRNWVSGHYQVSKLPPSMAQMRWVFGALGKNQEKDFIFRRLQALKRIPLPLQMAMTEIISLSQQSMRDFAARDIESSLRRLGQHGDAEIVDEVRTRSKSVVSLRDIQRVFFLYDFFLAGFPVVEELASDNKQRVSMLLSIAAVYLLRLDAQSRREFLVCLKNLPCERHEMLHLEDILEAALELVVENTSIKEGVAKTRGLKETVFMTLVCALSGTPLMVVGPPGCSKVSCPKAW